MLELIKHIKKIPGFKISNTHFRIGSKIHITKFYYAKHFFQNSFFASRLAFLVSKSILKDHLEKLDDIKTNGLTLIGYGLFSELLLSLVEQILRKHLGIIKINHDLINDIEEIEIIKGYEKVFKNIVIIVPIASTFSTAIKIEELLRRKHSECNILTPFINVIQIADSQENNDDENLSPLERQFGWVNKDIKNKIVTVNAFFAQDESANNNEQSDKYERKQRFFLTLPSEWHEIKNCKKCFPSNPSEEIPLFNSDSSSTSPLLIFDKPKAREIHVNELIKFTLSPSSLNYGHYVRDSTHYNYFIRMEDFFRENKDRVELWLKDIKQSTRFKDICKETDPVIIIAPGHYSNAGFVNIVNEILFSNSANIIHYDSKHDHIQNFQTFYFNEIENLAKKIFFVDDAINTGETFIRTNYFLKLSRRPKGFDSCIFLLNRSSNFVYNNMLRKIVGGRINIFSFANLHLPVEEEKDSSLLKEKNRYEELFDNSFLNRLKTYFLKQTNKLLEKKVSTINSIKDETTRHISQIEAIHRIFQWFSISGNNIEKIPFKEWKTSLLIETESPFINSLLTNSNNDDVSLSNETIALLKVLTQPPFIYYKNLKEITFKWVIEFLDSIFDKIRIAISENNLMYRTFEDLRFLIRRAGLLNANYLISNKLFELLELIHDYYYLKIEGNKIGKQTTDLVMSEGEKTEVYVEKSHELELFSSSLESDRIQWQQNFKSFKVFYTAQVKELLYLNEARCIQLEVTILKFDKGSNNSLFKQLLRIIREENGILIQKFWQFFKNDKELQDLEHISKYSLSIIEKIITKNSIKHHYRFKTIVDFFVASQEDAPFVNKEFLNYLILMNFFCNEKKQKIRKLDFSLSQKTDFIIDKLQKILNTDIESEMEIFFIVKYNTSSKYPYFFAYNRNNSGYGVDESKWDSENYEYLRNFLEGVDDNLSRTSHLTITEFKRRSDDKWFNLYTSDMENAVVAIDPSYISHKYNRLLLIKYNKFELDDDEKNEEFSNFPLGLMGFCFTKNDNELTNVYKTRYLLLLRDEMCNFILDHHENSEFRDWIDADKKQRVSLLTGHGREMLMEIAISHSAKYQDIVTNILLIQRLIIDMNDEIKIGSKKSRTKELFTSWYALKQGHIKSETILDLAKMAEEVFEFHEIECKVPCKVQANPIEAFSFPFPIGILEMICFELFVNAKKNRWTFLKGDEFFYDGNGITINRIFLNAALVEEDGEDFLILKVANTGPGVERDTINNLNQYREVKGYKSVAGLKLISTILELFDLGSISFSSTQVENVFSLFNVELKLKKWKYNEQENNPN